jgi:hypothetical protein
VSKARHPRLGNPRADRPWPPCCAAGSATGTTSEPHRLPRTPAPPADFASSGWARRTRTPRRRVSSARRFPSPSA